MRSNLPITGSADALCGAGDCGVQGGMPAHGRRAVAQLSLGFEMQWDRTRVKSHLKVHKPEFIRSIKADYSCML